MKWYGLKHFYTKKLIYNYKNNINLKNKKNLLFKLNNIRLNQNKFILFFPSMWNFIIFKNNSNSDQIHLYIYSSNYFFFFFFSNKFLILHCSNEIKIITFLFFYKNNFYNIFWNKFKNIFYSFSAIFFKKLKFKGKGYYIYKNFRNTIALQFGYSHIKRLYFYFSYVKFLSKTSILIYGINTLNINKISKALFNTRKINIFTGKGMRFTRQIMYKKTGKVSSYR